MEKKTLVGADEVWMESLSKLETIREAAVIVLGAGEEETPSADRVAQDTGGEQVCTVKGKQKAEKTLPAKLPQTNGPKREDSRKAEGKNQERLCAGRAGARIRRFPGRIGVRVWRK